MKLYKYTKHQIDELSKTGIYKITSKIDNKIYVGSATCTRGHSRTHKGFYGRFKDHIQKLSCNRHRNKHLQCAWNLYGEDNFEFEILEFCNEIDSSIKEIEWIDKLNVCNQEKGYNFIRQSLKNINSTSLETRKKLSNSLMGHKPALASIEQSIKSVIQLDLNDNFIEEFSSMTSAQNKTGAHRSAIRRVCLGIDTHANNYHWKYKYPQENSIKRTTWRKPLIIKNTITLEILEFESISKCSKILGFNRCTIRGYINNESLLDGKYLVIQN